MDRHNGEVLVYEDGVPKQAKKEMEKNSMQTKKRSTLYVPDPSRKECEISFEAVEWPDLKQASESMIGQYGFKFPLEIFGRAFVLTDFEAIRFGKHHLPFTMGIANSKGFSTWPLNEDGPKEHVRWLDDQEL